MPRRTETTLVNVGFGVRKVSEQQADERGNPLFGDSGLPKTADVWYLDLVDEVAPGHLDVIHVPLDANAKDALVKALTGGVEIVPANGMPAV